MSLQKFDVGLSFNVSECAHILLRRIAVSLLIVLEVGGSSDIECGGSGVHHVHATVSIDNSAVGCNLNTAFSLQTCRNSFVFHILYNSCQLMTIYTVFGFKGTLETNIKSEGTLLASLNANNDHVISL